jgi:hypothetical protein
MKVVCFLLLYKYNDTIWLLELSLNIDVEYLYDNENWLFELR